MHSGEHRSPRFARWGALLWRRPLAFGGLALVVLLVLALPVLSLRTGMPSIKVVPKGDRTFDTSDELWYFFELRNPGLDETGKPKIQTKVAVEGTTTKGQKVKMAAPMAPTPAEALKGVEGHFGVGSSIPLSGFKPGDYTMKLTVVDSVKNANYTLQQDFKVVEAGK